LHALVFRHIETAQYMYMLCCVDDVCINIIDECFSTYIISAKRSVIMLTTVGLSICLVVRSNAMLYD